MGRKKITITVYVDPDQVEALKKLRDTTGIPMAVLIRDAIDVAIMRWADPTDTVLAEAEQSLEAERVRADEAHTHSPAVYEELDLVLSHSRQLQLERNHARNLVEHYRATLRGVQNMLSDALSRPPGTSGAAFD